MNEDKENIRNDILNAARKRFEHYGFNKTTVEEISDDAGIGKGSIYHYFKSKHEVLIAIIVTFHQCILDQCEKVYHMNLPLKEHFIKLITTQFLTVYEYICSNPHGNELVQAVGTMKNKVIEAVTPIKNKQIDLLINLIKKGNDQGILNVKNPEKVAKHIMTSFEILYPANKSWNSVDEVHDYIETLVNLYFEGMIKR